MPRAWSQRWRRPGRRRRSSQKIQKDFSTALFEPATQKRLEDLGDEVIGSPPQVLAQYIKFEMNKCGPLIKEAKIGLDG